MKWKEGKTLKSICHWIPSHLIFNLYKNSAFCQTMTLEKKKSIEEI